MRKVLQFLREVKEQFHQITWPQKDTLINLTFVVISISVVTSLILGGFDYLFTQGFGFLGNINSQTTPKVEIPVDTAIPSASESSPSTLPKN